MPKITREGQELEVLAAKFKLKSLVDIGARLLGSNTWTLVNHKKFDAILLDKNPNHCAELKRECPRADVRQLTVTTENVNEFVSETTGILCIDIDGNDYHVWKAVEATPKVVVIESSPEGFREDINYIESYDPGNRKRMGSGVDALKALAKVKGYAFHKQIGVNLIFLRIDHDD